MGFAFHLSFLAAIVFLVASPLLWYSVVTLPPWTPAMVLNQDYGAGVAAFAGLVCLLAAIAFQVRADSSVR